MVRQEIRGEDCGAAESLCNRPGSSDKPGGGLTQGPGRFLHANRQSPEELVQGWEREEVLSSAKAEGEGVGEGTGPCRKDGENLGPLEGLDLEAGRACWAT